MTLAAVGTLFPAIPLAIVALNFRYTSLAGLMRAISSQLESSGIDGARRTTLLDELHVMKRRMTLVKYALFLSGIAFILNLASLYFVSPSAPPLVFPRGPFSPSARAARTRKRATRGSSCSGSTAVALL